MPEKIKPIILPKDNGVHDNTIEWWYFNGHLKDKSGLEYSFMDCFFKVDFIEVNIPHILNNPLKDHYKKGKYIYFAHSVISDILNKKNYKEIQNISFVSHDSFSKDKFFVSYSNPSILGDSFNSEIEEKESNGFHIKTKELDLVLESNKSPLLEGGHGYIGTPKAGSYYYSLTDMPTKGTLCIDGKEIEVEGKAWMDHQWANAVYKKDKWTWFSFQLENGTEIMCVEYCIGNKTDTLINTIDKDGKQRQYKKAIFKHGKNLWKSEETKAGYPMSWYIEIPEADIFIKAHSTMDDQEMIFGQINYWEGPMDVVAKINGISVKGKGFMELVGYPSDYNYILLVLRKIKRYIGKKLETLDKLRK